MAEGFLVLRPGDCPFDAAAIGKLDLAEEWLRRQRRALADGCREEIGEAAGKMQLALLRHVVGTRQGRIAAPMDLDAAEEIGLGARHAVEQRGTEMRVGAEYLGIGVEAHRGAAPVLHRAEILELGLRLAAAVFLCPQLAIPRHLDRQFVGEGVDHRDADAVQPARGLISIAAELAAGMEHRQDDLERRFAGEFGMRVDRDAAAVIAHGDGVVDAELDLDAAGMAGDRLVHRIVDDLGSSVPPIYMPGRRRTGSSPSSTSMSFAE